MTRFTLQAPTSIVVQRCSLTLAAATAVLLSACASDPSQGQAHATADAGYTPLGSLIPRKAPSRQDNVTIVDKQSLENDRTNGNGTNNWAANKN